MGKHSFFAEHLEGHWRCKQVGTHICYRPTGKACVEPGCNMGAGTRWGPLWCPDHDSERLHRISTSLAEFRGNVIT